MKTNPNEPSIPFDAYIAVNGELSNRNTNETLDRRFYGMTKREEFAKSSMVGLLSFLNCENPEWGLSDDNLDYIAKRSIYMADKIIEELNRIES